MRTYVRFELCNKVMTSISILVVYMLDSLTSQLYADCMGKVNSQPTDLGLEDYAQQLGQRLRQLRLERRMSQEVVSLEAGISTFTYRKLEYGESNPGTPANPRLKTLLSLSNVFGVEIQDLLPRA